MMNILVVNAGSSSHKISLYQLENEVFIQPIWKGEIDWGQNSSIKIKVKNKEFKENVSGCDLEEVIEHVLKTLCNGPTKVIENLSMIHRIGHRVVHGGSLFNKPAIINRSVKDQIRSLNPLAPLHNPKSLEEIELFECLFPSAVQVAAFDTTFHQTMPEETKTYPIPKEWRDLGIEHYGFHGISHHYCAEQIATLCKNQTLKIINCHLGSGCSLCAIKEGKSLTTTMGFTPLDGLMMGTRSGSIDPSIVIYLMQEHGMDIDQIEKGLNFESGLKGIARTSDMREITSRKDKEALLAFNMFIFRLKSFIGQMAAVLGGVDVLNFTGGIGEHSALIRLATCEGLEFLSLKLDMDLNDSLLGGGTISTKDSKVKIMVVPTQEEWMIAKAVYQEKT